MSSGCSHEDSENIEFIICFNQPATVKTGGFNQQKMAFNQHTGWGFRFRPTESGVETNKHRVDSNSPSRNWGNHSGNPVSAVHPSGEFHLFPSLSKLGKQGLIPFGTSNLLGDL